MTSLIWSVISRMKELASVRSAERWVIMVSSSFHGTKWQYTCFLNLILFSSAVNQFYFPIFKVREYEDTSRDFSACLMPFYELSFMSHLSLDFCCSFTVQDSSFFCDLTARRVLIILPYPERE